MRRCLISNAERKEDISGGDQQSKLSDPDSSQLQVAQIDTFSLSDLDGAGAGGPSRRGGRHLRQIEELRCTPDGQYAIIRCSDNTVVLYR